MSATRKPQSMFIRGAMVVAMTSILSVAGAAFSDQWLSYAGGTGPGAGKHIVLISGDEEYRSEEALPMLARILSEHHGFDCTVLFAYDTENGIVNPYTLDNIPGLDHLASADLMVIATRFRNLPDAQMKHIDGYLKSGKPVVGLRTATHAFMIPPASPWGHYGNGYSGPKTEWKGGFGRLILGEMWINHHGRHKVESTLGRLAEGAQDHPILRGISDGDIWVASDVYGVRLPLPGDSMPLVLGEVRTRPGRMDRDDLDFGMRKEDPISDDASKNDPMMPVAWTKTYQVPEGDTGRVFMTTMGAASDLRNEALRRLVVNGVYWALSNEDAIPAEGAKVDLVGKFSPSQFSFNGAKYWIERGLKIDDLR